MVHIIALRLCTLPTANRLETPQPQLVVPLELAVMGEGPLPSPEFALKRVGVFQADAAAIGLTDMGYDHPAVDRVVLHQFGHLGAAGGLWIFERAAALAVIEGDPPAIGVGAGFATAAGQASKAETDIRGDIGTHA